MIHLVLGVSACTSASRALPYGSDAEACASCHVAHGDAWRGSAHATSGTSPMFEALLPRVEAAWGSTARDACVGCHQPGHGGDEGIGCVSCHAAVGNHGTADGQLALDLDAPLAGPLGLGATTAHTSTRRGLLTDDTLCGTCHEVTGPGLFVETTYTEHDADGAEGCVTCHATPVAEGAWVEGGSPRAQTDHRHVGMDTPLYADDDETSASRATTAALLRSALALTVDAGIARVTHAGRGHGIPTGVTFFRDLWVEVDTHDGARRLAQIGTTGTRHGEAVALITDADRVTDTSLAPGQTLEFPLPDDSTGTVRLLARPWRSDVLTALDLGELDAAQPVYTVATLPLE